MRLQPACAVAGRAEHAHARARLTLAHSWCGRHHTPPHRPPGDLSSTPPPVPCASCLRALLQGGPLEARLTRTTLNACSGTLVKPPLPTPPTATPTSPPRFDLYFFAVATPPPSLLRLPRPAYLMCERAREKRCHQRMPPTRPHVDLVVAIRLLGVAVTAGRLRGRHTGRHRRG